MKKEEVSIGTEVQWKCGMGYNFAGKVISIEENGNLIVVELFGGSRKWVRVEDLSRKS